jgi:hypothetical protein
MKYEQRSLFPEVSDVLRDMDTQLRAHDELLRSDADEVWRFAAAEAITRTLADLPQTLAERVEPFAAFNGGIPDDIKAVVTAHAAGASRAPIQLPRYSYGNLFLTHGRGNIPNFADKSILEKLADKHQY